MAEDPPEAGSAHADPDALPSGELEALPPDELEALPSGELHDRAVALARDRRDVRFLWELLRAVPAAAAATGQVDRAEYDMLHVLSLLEEYRSAGDSDLADALRPFYMSYLTEHGGDAEPGAGPTERPGGPGREP